MPFLIALAALGVGLFFLATRASQAAPGEAYDPDPLPNGWDEYTPLPDVAGPWESTAPEVPPQTTTPWEDIAVAVSPGTYFTPGLPAIAMERNLSAFLDMIAAAEGTAGPDGYRTMFGYRLFESFADHPRQYFPFTNGAGVTLKTSAAGRYQFLARTWDDLARKLNLLDFGPASQDAACIELIRQRGALNDAKAGRVVVAVAKCAPIWASLPGAGYNQPERKITMLVAAFSAAGGTLEA